PLGAFLACVHSVRSQSFTDWEWCLVDDCSTRPEVLAALQQAAESDPRIKVHRRAENGGIVAASNDALAMATGEFVALLDHDDAIVPTGLASVMAALDDPAGADIDYVYTDEAHTLADGRESAHFLKPDWSPERFRSSMYTCHLSVLRRSVVSEIDGIGGFRVGFDGSQDHDLMLRATEHITAEGRRIVHLPVLAYHWRNIATSVSRAVGTLSNAVQNGRRAVQEQVDRLGLDAEVVHGPVAGCYRLVRRAIDHASVTVVVATRFEGAAIRPYRSAVEATVRALTTDRPNVRLVVAHPANAPSELVDLLDSVMPAGWDRVPVAGEWHLATALDRALLLHPADVLVSVAPGMVPRVDRTPDWLGALVGLALSPGAGVVGSLIADRDDQVHHAGWDVPNYRWYELEGLPVGQTTSGNDLLIERECTHVSLAAAGCRTLWTPYARFDEAVALEL
ncbi:MAG: glycosyltransferase, partial [Actinobacteria bacterium]|nr:glycosyltransferase [Actinomycetota bacterium]